MKIGKFKKIAAIGLALTMAIGLLYTSGTVNAVDSSIESKRIDVEGLVTDKTAEYDESKDAYKITLDVYNTGYKSQSTEVVPTDIVLVLDQSSSMTKSLETTYRDVYYSFSGSAKSAYDSQDNLYHKCGANDAYNKVNVSRYREDRWHKYIYTIQCSACEEIIFQGESRRDNITRNDNLYTLQREEVGTISRLEGLKSAVTSFVDQVAKNAEDNGVNHRIAMVGFATGSYVGSYGYSEYENTEGFIGNQSYNYNNNRINSFYKNAFQDMSTTDGINNIKSSIGLLDARGATNVNLGMNMANNIFENNKSNADEQRNQIVILFSDGEPSKWDGYDSNIANDSLRISKNLKDSGVTIYSIGVFEGANPNEDPNGNNPNTNNKFLQYTSSNYPTASKMDYGYWDDKPEKAEDSNYYLTAEDSESLKNVFEQIEDDISQSEVTLDKNTVVKDVMSDYFVVDKTKPFSVNEIPCIRYDTEKQEYVFAESGTDITGQITKDVQDNYITVNNYEFDKNLVMQDTSSESGVTGNKLQITFYAKPKDGFIGGNAVPTNNLEQSGIIVNNGLIENFPYPLVDVDINYYTDSVDKAMYIGNSWENFEEFVLSNNTIVYKTEESQNDGYALNENSFANDFVTIKYTIMDGSNPVGTYVIDNNAIVGHWETTPESYLANNDVTKNYTIKVDIENVNQASSTDLHDQIVNKTNSLDSKLFIYVPQVSSNDGNLFLGNSKELNEYISFNNWICADDSVINPPSPDGEEPMLSYVITGEDTSNNIFTPNEVGKYIFTYVVESNGYDITQYTHAVHNSSEHEKCINKDFIINVEGGTIELSKIIDEMENYPLQEDPIFIFKIDQKGNNGVNKTYYRIVRMSYNEDGTFDSSDIPTITGLPAGKYTITELSSMRFGFVNATYNGSDKTKTFSFEITNENRNANIVYKNKLEFDDSFSDNDVIVNSFSKNEDGSIKITQDWLNKKGE